MDGDRFLVPGGPGRKEMRTSLFFVALGIVLGLVLPLDGAVVFGTVVLGTVVLIWVAFLLAWATTGRRTRTRFRHSPLMTIAFLLAATARFVVTTADLLQITLLSVLVSGTSTVLATLIAVPLGALLGLHELGSARLLRNILFTLYGLPPVLAGLLVFLALSRGGPLGGLGLLYTPLGMVIAQEELFWGDAGIGATVLGADRYQLSVTVLREAAAGVLTAVMVGLGRAISEVGAVFIVGRHIEGQTQVLTTTIITDVSQAEYTHAVALGVILLVIAGVIYSLLYRLQERTLP